MADDPATQPPPPNALTMPRLVVLLILTIGATGAVVYFAVRGGGSNEAVVGVVDVREAQVNTGEVLDATVPNQYQPELGRRYRVRIEGESRDGASMIARIGRTVTFIKDAKPGEIVEVEVTRLQRTTAEAIVLNRAVAAPAAGPEPAGTEPEGAPSASTDPEDRLPSRPATPAAPGEVYTGVVVSVGRYGDGLVKRGGQSIYVPGAAEGERVVYEIVEKRDRFWSARLVRQLAAEESGRPARDLSRADHVQPGQEYEVVVREKERSKPDTDGVARIDGLVVLIPDSQPGQRLKIRITERRPTLAKAEIIERFPPAP